MELAQIHLVFLHKLFSKAVEISHFHFIQSYILKFTVFYCWQNQSRFKHFHCVKFLAQNVTSRSVAGMMFRGNESTSICRNQTNLKSFLRNELCASPITFFGTNPKREQHENVIKFCNPILQQQQLYITTRRLTTTSSSLLLMVCLPSLQNQMPK